MTHTNTSAEAGKNTAPAPRAGKPTRRVWEVVDPDGVTHTRASTTKVFTHATVRKLRGNGVYGASFATSLELAEREARAVTDRFEYIAVEPVTEQGAEPVQADGKAAVDALTASATAAHQLALEGDFHAAIAGMDDAWLKLMNLRHAIRTMEKEAKAQAWTPRS